MKSILQVVENLLKPYIDDKDDALNDALTNQKIIVATKTLVAGSAEQSFAVTGLTANHVLLQYELGTPSNVTSDISWDTNTTGYIKLTGTIATGGTTIKMYFGLQQ